MSASIGRCFLMLEVLVMKLKKKKKVYTMSNCNLCPQCPPQDLMQKGPFDFDEEMSSSAPGGIWSLEQNRVRGPQDVTAGGL